MPSANYVLLEKITVGAAGASSVTFSGIPQTGYTDLVLKMSVRTDRASTDDLLNFNFNGVSSNQSSRNLQGNGSAASSGTYGSNLYLAWVDAASNTASTFGNAEMYIPNYTSSNFKSVSTDGVLENNASTAVMGMTAGLWSSTAAITSIAITSVFSSNFVQYSTFYLYGVAKLGTTPAIVPYATGGDTIMTDGTYWYHTFISSGTFTPAKAITCDYLVVAGGGGGGYFGGGGGAGGLRSTVTATGGGGSLETALSLGTSAYTVTVGAGGSGSTAAGNAGINGSNSVFSTITSTGGGGGGAFDNNNAALGGSGGGGGNSTTAKTGGAGTANQGFAGGNNSTTANSYPAGGGGGAGAVGQAGVSNTAGGAGGAGVAVSISGSSVTYAGGGGGAINESFPVSAGGSGGGGNGGNNVTLTGGNGTANLGSGGGGGRNNGGNGGSGIVIVRYAV